MFLMEKLVPRATPSRLALRARLEGVYRSLGGEIRGGEGEHTEADRWMRRSEERH